GYTGALPQIMQKCGVHYFMTIKLSWDRYNIYPNHSFFWQGIDGSRVLVHMPPEGTYNSSAMPEAIKKSEREYLDKAVSENCLLVYGIGDGGGGPGEEHLERLQREKNLEGIAPVTQENVLEFFKRLESEQGNFQTWTGELYLGMHQGTYTTQGRSKWFNRKLEIALREAEFWASFANLMTDENYPQQQLETIWKELLLYQFHDILPGSSITRVYDESLQRYALLLQQVLALLDNFLQAIFKLINTADFENPIIITNSLLWERSEWLKIDTKWYHLQLPAMGYATIDAGKPAQEFPQLLAQSYLLENDILLVKFNDEGTIISVFDSDNQKEVIFKGGLANELIVYHDDGDAWDFSVDYEYRTAGKFELVSSEAFLDGPKAVMKQVRQFGESKLIQKIMLTAGSRRIDFETEVEWNERHKMLRASFPVAIQANESVSEIQFGHIRRPTNQNTSWERAKFEICAHKWIDISQPDYGVALLNDSKYGYRVFGSTLDINLLRSSALPDPQADRGKHQFTYSLFPHAGNHISGGVVRAGYELNVPIKAIATAKHSGKLLDKLSFFTIDSDNVILETIKKAEKNDEIILRLYEAFGMRKKVTIHSAYPIQSAQLTNMLEEKIETLEITSNSFSLEFKPFEIHTARLKLEI
ncbi:MAG: glycosyl hydrolase-related protein, partial [bacterium]|nr:glycosyl hydrolase-related protein [bacterium]